MPHYMRLGSFDVTIDERTNLVTDIELNYHQNCPQPTRDGFIRVIGYYYEITNNSTTVCPFSNVEDRHGHVRTEKHTARGRTLPIQDVALILQQALAEISIEQIHNIVGRQLPQIGPFQTQLAQTIGQAIVSWCEQALQNRVLREQQTAAIYSSAASVSTSTVTTPPASPPATTTAHSTSSGDFQRPPLRRRNAEYNVAPLTLF